MKKLFFILFLISIKSLAQTIENIRFVQDSVYVKIYFDLVDIVPGQIFDVKTYLSTNGGNTFGNKPLPSVVGDVNINDTKMGLDGIAHCNITWDALLDVNELVSNNIMFKVVANNISGVVDGSAHSPLIQKGRMSDSRDGKIYNTITVDQTVWMAQNIDYEGDEKAYCYDDQANNCHKYGKLYDWQAARKICPTGWKLPSEDDWNELVNKLGGKGFASYSKLIKDGATGFDALFAGWRGSYYDFSDINNVAYFWSSTEYDAENARFFALTYRYKNTSMDSFKKNCGFSVRCIKKK